MDNNDYYEMIIGLKKKYNSLLDIWFVKNGFIYV